MLLRSVFSKWNIRLRHHANNDDQKVSPFVNFIIGGLSGAAGQTATHPFDVFKVRMQVSKASLSQTIRVSLKHIGIQSFYIGWTASILRQLTYSTARLGMYTTLYDLAQGYFGRLNYPTMVSIGMLSGVVGAFVGTPTDLVLIRMVADVNLPPEKRRNYNNAIVGLIDIWKTEGTRGLWRGAVPTMTRAAIVNGTQLGTYSRAKMMLIDTGHFEEGVILQFLAAMISGLVMCTASLPVDVAKTRIQNWNLPTKPPGIVSMMISIVQNEGVTSLWRGFLPYYCRAAPNAVITMICMDQLHRMYREFFKPSTE